MLRWSPDANPPHDGIPVQSPAAPALSYRQAFAVRPVKHPAALSWHALRVEQSLERDVLCLRCRLEVFDDVGKRDSNPRSDGPYSVFDCLFHNR